MLREIKILIENYYEMSDGKHIQDFHKEIIINNNSIKIKLKHRVLKHVVEQRKRDGYDISKLHDLFADLYCILEKENYKIVKNKKEDSLLFLEIIENKNTGVVLVLEIVLEICGVYYIKTGFYRSASKIKKLLK